ncbi:MAG: DUF427 domain-containing protein [Gammaproteobacteria bacterium]|nr:DUF427 domain-containing protein [Gammaproteobacteria bacterium]MBU1625023.1 DUF427 domain-containing protein [Gammaproteobacteria bacterium]MBU1981283.1 DUF427 domain-containing protein [Gammaproteobacteria bacterium]
MEQVIGVEAPSNVIHSAALPVLRRAWKGKGSYCNVEVDDKVNEDAAWHYPEPSAMAARLKDHVAFWRGVKVEVDHIWMD